MWDPERKGRCQGQVRVDPERILLAHMAQLLGASGIQRH